MEVRTPHTAPISWPFAICSGGHGEIVAEQFVDPVNQMDIHAALISLLQAMLPYKPQAGKPENLIRQTGTIEGMTQVQAYDELAGCRINPFQGRRDPEMMGEDDTRALVDGADFMAPSSTIRRRAIRLNT
jgi:hypothetical protein